MSVPLEVLKAVNKEVRVLLIEDSEDDALLIERVLLKGGLQPTLERVSTADEMNRALDEHTWDTVLCDYMMPKFSIKDAMKEIELRGLDLPFIIVSGTISDEIAVEMMQAGAHDYLTKNNLSRLVPAMEREISEAGQRRKRRVAEEALRESERKHRMLVESLTDTVFVLEPDGEISEFYSQSGIIPGVSPGKHLGRNLSSLFPSVTVGKYTDTMRAVLETGDSLSFEHVLDAVGIRKWVSINLSPHEDGKRIVVVMRDVSALKKAEEEARAAHNVALLYQDITGHDIRNYLQAILIASDLLSTYETDTSRSSLIDHINDSVSECSDLIASVQSTATLLSTPLEKVALDFSLKSCIDVFMKDHEEVTIEKRISKSKETIHADQFLNHLIMNLLSNAAKYNEKEKKTIWVELKEDDGGYIFTISDDGPGISDAMKKNLLNPERRSGGVGIHQCVQIASKYRGTFEIHDRVDGDHTQGTRFRVWLPKSSS
ncbi:MAG: ATP-binding protein [Candidatus Thorarchaeota archaeon]|jgi:PAS domain S-box-containing protein